MADKLPLSLPYTICFCLSQGKALMIYRYWPPHQYLWNGVGGKIEENETPNDAVRREVWEEGELDLKKACATRFAGIVTWSGLTNSPNNNKGMYAFVSEFEHIETEWEKREIDEGRLEWKELEWVLDTSNNSIAENVPHFLPRMLEGGELREYHCVYDEGKLKEVMIKQLPSFISRETNLFISRLPLTNEVSVLRRQGSPQLCCGDEGSKKRTLPRKGDTS